MPKSSQRTDSEKIKMIVSELINRGEIKNEAELCAKLGYPTGNFAKIKSGERNIPASLKLSLIKTFKITDDFLSYDRMPIVSGEIVTQVSTISVDSEYFSLLKKTNHIYEQNLASANIAIEELSKGQGTFRQIVHDLLGAGAMSVDMKKVKVVVQKV